jgi:hypothetical protein
MNVQSFETTRAPILGLPLGNTGEKWHLDVVPMGGIEYNIRRGMVSLLKSCGLREACV